jgi:hypothetical protein
LIYAAIAETKVGANQFWISCLQKELHAKTSNSQRDDGIKNDALRRSPPGGM